MERIRVVVQGAQGKMGREVVNAVLRSPEMELVGATEKKTEQDFLLLPDGAGKVPFGSDPRAIFLKSKPHVVVDFSAAEAAMAAVRVAAELGVNLVVGTTGLTQENIQEIEKLCKEKRIGVVVASNFALGAVVMIHLAKIAARYFDSAEIIEMHHDKKADAPSGTALSTARAMLEARGSPFVYPPTSKETLAGTRGGQSGGIAIHSMRLPGLMAHQEIVFGASGQTLSICHDTISRECYMPGVILAIKEVVKRKGLIYGLDALLGL